MGKDSNLSPYRQRADALSVTPQKRGLFQLIIIATKIKYLEGVLITPPLSYPCIPDEMKGL